MIRALFLCAAFALPATVSAHSAVDSSRPADGAVLTAAPESLGLTFGNPARLTRVTLSGEVLNLPDQSGFGTMFEIPLDPLVPGNYTVQWRALSVDGHAVSGGFSFSVD